MAVETGEGCAATHCREADQRGGLGSNILSSRCTAKERGVAGRYSLFTCDTRYGGSNGSHTTLLIVRVLPVGSGKLCIATVRFENLPGKYFALDASSGKPGPPTKPEFACRTA